MIGNGMPYRMSFREGFMQDWQPQTLQDYKNKGFAERSGYGSRPGLLIVDFIKGDDNAPVRRERSKTDAGSVSHVADAASVGR